MPNTVHFSLSKDGRTAFVAVKIGSTGKKVEFDVELPPPAGETTAAEVDFDDDGLVLALKHTTNLDVRFRDQDQLAAAAGDIEHGRVRTRV